MDSIKQQQPEQNRFDLRGAKAVAKMKQLVDKAKTLLLLHWRNIEQLNGYASNECTGSGRAR
jgi:hypothetical protein